MINHLQYKIRVLEVRLKSEITGYDYKTITDSINHCYKKNFQYN